MDLLLERQEAERFTFLVGMLLMFFKSTYRFLTQDRFQLLREMGVVGDLYMSCPRVLVASY